MPKQSKLGSITSMMLDNFNAFYLERSCGASNRLRTGTPISSSIAGSRREGLSIQIRYNSASRPKKMPRRPAAVYVAATRQHVGKTSTCLGLLQGLTSRLDAIGFLKPVGQESVFVEHANVRVDKDVAVAKGEQIQHFQHFQGAPRAFRAPSGLHEVLAASRDLLWTSIRP